jgi:hypothetical protein
VLHVEPPRVDVTDPFAGIDAIQTDQAARVPTLDDLLAGMPPGPESLDIDFDIETSAPPPVAAPPSIPAATPAPSYVEGPAPSRVQGPPIEPPDATPTLTAAPPPPVMPAPGGVEATSGRSIIADAFSAMLAAEQGEPGAAMPRLAGNGSSSIAVTDTMIDDVARRVVQKLALGSSEQMQAMVREIVSSVAERLVREEIDRIRGRLHY